MRAWAVGALLVLAAGPAWSAAPACDKCEFLPCVQSELTHYKDTQKMYLDLAAKFKAMDKEQAMDMTAFSKQANDATNSLLDRHNARIKDLPACQVRYPEGLKEGDYAAQRTWTTTYGFGFEDLGGGKVNALFSAVTDPVKCQLRERQLHGLMEILSCADLAVATRKHEEKHVADCGKAKPATPEDYARFEAAGYAEGIKELEKTVRRIKNKKCPKPQPSHLQGPKAHEAMKKALDAAGRRLSMYLKARAYH